MKAADEQYMDVERAASELNVDVDALMEMGSRNLLIVRGGCEISRSSFLVLKVLLSSIRRRWVDQEIAVDFIGSSRKLQELVRSGKVEMRLYMGIAFYKEADLAKHTVFSVEPPAQEKPASQRQAKTRDLTTAPRKKRRQDKPRLIRALVSGKSSGPKSEDEELVTVKEASDLLNTDIGVIWSWVKRGAIESVTIPGRRSRSHLVKMRSLKPWLASDFANQKRYSFTEVGRMPGIFVSRQTIRNWRRKGKIETCLGPGGQPYVPEDQLPKCRELAQMSVAYKPRSRTPTPTP